MKKIAARFCALFDRTLTELQSVGLAAIREKPRLVSSSSSEPKPLRLPWVTTGGYPILVSAVGIWTARAYFYGASPASMNVTVACAWLVILWVGVQSFVKLALTLASPLSEAARARFRYDYNKVLVAPPFIHRAVAGFWYRFNRFLLVVPAAVASVLFILMGDIFTGIALLLTTALDSFSERTAVHATLNRLGEIGQREITVVEGPQELETGTCGMPGVCCMNLETRQAVGVDVGEKVRITYEATGKSIVRPVIKVSRNVAGKNDVIYLHPVEFHELEVPNGPLDDVKMLVEKEGDTPQRDFIEV